MINRQSLAEQVYKVLKEKIIKGEVRSGQKLLEDDISSELGVSKTPVRQALGWLEKDGLVNGAKGYTREVATLTTEEAVEIYAVRAVLEGLAAKLIAGSPEKDKIVEDLEQILDEATELMEKQEVNKVLQKDREFHNLILHASGNVLLEDLMRNLRYKIMLVQVDNLYPGDSLRSSMTEHRKLIDAMKQGNGDATELMMKKHISRIIKDKFASKASNIDKLVELLS